MKDSSRHIKAALALLFLGVQLITNAQTDSTVVYDDLCIGCCGLELTLHSYGRLEYDQRGATRFFGSGSWWTKGDKLIVKYDAEKSKYKFLQQDSLTLVPIEPNALPLLKTGSIHSDGRWLTYTYDENRSIREITTYLNGALLQIRQFDGDKVCEKTFDLNGQILTDGCFLNGKKSGEWLHFSPEGKLLRTEMH